MSTATAKGLAAADDLAYFGNKLIQARGFAEIAWKNERMYSDQREEDRDADREYFIRKAYRLGQHVIDFIYSIQLT